MFEGSVISTNEQDGNSFYPYGVNSLVAETQNRQVKIYSCFFFLFFFPLFFSIATECGYISEDIKSLV